MSRDERSPKLKSLLLTQLDQTSLRVDGIQGVLQSTEKCA